MPALVTPELSDCDISHFVFPFERTNYSIAFYELKVKIS